MYACWTHIPVAQREAALDWAAMNWKSLYDAGCRRRPFTYCPWGAWVNVNTPHSYFSPGERDIARISGAYFIYPDNISVLSLLQDYTTDVDNGKLRSVSVAESMGVWTGAIEW